MKTISKKNYLILLVIMISSIGLLYYLYLWYDAYEKNALKTSVMSSYLTMINYNELENYIVENKKVYVYTSFVNDKTVKEYEYSFKNEIIKKDLKNKILYMDLTDELESNIELNYNLSLENIPCILVFEDGKLIKSYNIKESKYDSKKTVAFLVSEDILEDD